MPGIYDTVKRFFINLTEAFLLLIALSVVGEHRLRLQPAVRRRG